MNSNTGITYASRGLSISVGCGGPVTEACDNCWARNSGGRIKTPAYQGILERSGPRSAWTGEIKYPHTVEVVKHEIGTWQGPQICVVAFMGDAFSPGADFGRLQDYIDMIAEECSTGNVFLFLTKFYKNLKKIKWPAERNILTGVTDSGIYGGFESLRLRAAVYAALDARNGMSVWLSAEPAMFNDAFPTDHVGNLSDLSWVVIGAESGPRRAMLTNAAVEESIDVFGAREVPIYVKQLAVAGARTASQITSDDPARWPPNIRVRQYPSFFPTPKRKVKF